MEQSTPEKFIVWRQRQRAIAEAIEMLQVKDEVNPIGRTAYYLKKLGDSSAAQADRVRKRRFPVHAAD